MNPSIDRNGRLFEYVLDYLRTSEIHLPSFVSPAALEKELQFYGLYDVDMSNVIGKNRVEYGISVREKAETLALEVRAIRLAALAESEFWQHRFPPESLSVSICSEDDKELVRREDLLHERLLDKGLQLVSMNKEKNCSYNFVFKVANA
jgi:hypothetical protein